MVRLSLCVILALAAVTSLADAQQARLAAAVAPNARAVAANTPATVFATIINAGQAAATNCRVEAEAGNFLGSNVAYQRTDSANQPIGTANTPFDIPPSGIQTLVLTLTPETIGQDRNYELLYICDETQLPGIPGVSDVLINTYTNADIIMILQTLSGDGVVRFAENGRRGVAAGAAINIGAPSDILDFTPSFPGFLNSPVGPSYTHYRDLLICQTDANSICLSPPAASFRLTGMATNAVITFNVYFDDSAEADIPFLPEFLRIYVGAYESDSGPFGGPLGAAGATTVAVSEPDGPGNSAAGPGYGHWYGYFGNAANYTTHRIKIILSPDGDFILRPLLDSGFTPQLESSEEFLFGQVSPGRNGAVLNPTGTVSHFSDFQAMPDTVVDGLVLNVQGRADGRIAPLNNERIRGYFERVTPDAVLDFEPSVEGVTRVFDFRAAAFAGFDFDASLTIQPSRRQFTGQSRVFAGTDVSNCDMVIDIVPRQPAQGQPAPQTFDVTMSVQPCSGTVTEADPSGTYTGWAAVDTWVTDSRLTEIPAACALVGVLERQSDGFSFPFFLTGDAYTSDRERVNCGARRF